MRYSISRASPFFPSVDDELRRPRCTKWILKVLQCFELFLFLLLLRRLRKDRLDVGGVNGVCDWDYRPGVPEFLSVSHMNNFITRFIGRNRSRLRRQTQILIESTPLLSLTRSAGEIKHVLLLINTFFAFNIRQKWIRGKHRRAARCDGFCEGWRGCVFRSDVGTQFKNAISVVIGVHRPCPPTSWYESWFGNGLRTVDEGKNVS